MTEYDINYVKFLSGMISEETYYELQEAEGNPQLVDESKALLGDLGDKVEASASKPQKS